MGVPISQMWTVASYVLSQKIKRRKRYPLVLMLEPLFRCNLACAGCGKIQYPAHILRQDLPLEDALRAVDECDAPMVSIPGGEPLLYPHIRELVEELVKRRKYIYLCTNALLLKEKLDAGWFKPSKYLSFSVHMDGRRDEHDFAVCRDGTYDKAIIGIRMAVEQGFRVTTNTTLFEGTDPNAVREFFDQMMDVGVEGMMVSPGYAYDKAPDQTNFLHRKTTNNLFEMILSNRKKRWKFNQSPLFLEFLMGTREYECTPWGNPTYNIFGWQKPCYLLQEGYVDTFQELLDDTEWDNYGRASGNPQCRDCMVHCGYEPTAVDHTFSSFGGIWGNIKAMLFNRYANPGADKRLEEESGKPHGPMAHLVQLGYSPDLKDKAGAA
ncbi:MAG: hopanoid biosynthesis associated radical SAM protein HpnH [Phycisphaerae bacterium]|nr:hopanoid biosynthesis associated radical SAM protein HpnH [Phycisphaerae bacterium]MDG1898611.1 adenosyl-hopene transferase HpnH [Phycisphaerales bacterium]